MGVANLITQWVKGPSDGSRQSPCKPTVSHKHNGNTLKAPYSAQTRSSLSSACLPPPWPRLFKVSEQKFEVFLSFLKLLFICFGGFGKHIKSSTVL